MLVIMLVTKKEVENEQKNRELALENAKLRTEIDSLKAALAHSRENIPKANPNSSRSFDFNSFLRKGTFTFCSHLMRSRKF